MLLAICTTVTYFSDVRQIIEENYQDSFYPIQLSDFVIAVNGLIASVIMCFFSCKYRVGHFLHLIYFLFWKFIKIDKNVG